MVVTEPRLGAGLLGLNPSFTPYLAYDWGMPFNSSVPVLPHLHTGEDDVTALTHRVIVKTTCTDVGNV